MTLVAEHVSVTYPGPPPVPAVQDVSCEVAIGEFVAIVGPSGSGKSSLLHALGALLTPTAGRVIVDGTDVASLGGRARDALRARGIGFVFQQSHMIEHRSVVDNVALGALYLGDSVSSRRREARQALGWVGIAHLADALPKRLSGGERQRVGIARALMGRPRLLLCDEPTGNLDSAATAAIVELLDRLRTEHELLVVVVTHDPAVEVAADRSIEIRDGRLAP